MPPWLSATPSGTDGADDLTGRSNPQHDYTCQYCQVTGSLDDPGLTILTA